jgi:hypothetical protein
MILFHQKNIFLGEKGLEMEIEESGASMPTSFHIQK